LNPESNEREACSESLFCINNTSGSLVPSDNLFLYCLFCPFEEREYKLQLVIYILDYLGDKIQDINVDICGEGCSSSAMVTEKEKEKEQMPK